MAQITLQQIEAEHTKVSELIAAFKAQATRQIVVPAKTIDLREGERYAGIFIDGGVPQHHLILLPKKARTRLSWQASMDWAESAGGVLASRFEYALAYASLREEFDTSYAHWTSTQSSDTSAWYQYFGLATQGCSGKGVELVARAFRRLPL